LPGEVVGAVAQKNIFGFSDALLGDHIRTAYQALAIDEKRKDFVRYSFAYVSVMLIRFQAPYFVGTNPEGS